MKPDDVAFWHGPAHPPAPRLDSERPLHFVPFLTQSGPLRIRPQERKFLALRFQPVYRSTRVKRTIAPKALNGSSGGPERSHAEPKALASRR